MQGTPRVRVLIVHSAQLIARGIAATLDRSRFEIRTRPASGPAGPREEADLVVADYRCGMSWLERRASCDWSPAPRVLIVTDLDGEGELRAALSAGASGYVLQDCSADDLTAAALAVAQGLRHVAPAVAQRLVDSVGSAALTAREADVLDLVCAGLCNKSIGRRLGISLGTVKAHVSSILGKLSAVSRTQAIARASERGLIQIRPRLRMQNPVNVAKRDNGSRAVSS